MYELWRNVDVPCDILMFGLNTVRKYLHNYLNNLLLYKINNIDIQT